MSHFDIFFQTLKNCLFAYEVLVPESRVSDSFLLSKALGDIHMAGIPGLDSDDEDTVPRPESPKPFPVIQPKREAEEQPDEPASKRRHVEPELDDEDDLDLYGDESVQTGTVSLGNRTLRSEKLPFNEADFVKRLLDADIDLESEEIRIQNLFEAIRQMEQIDAGVNVFQVTFLTCLWLEALTRRRKETGSEPQLFYPFVKTQDLANFLFLHCVRVVAEDELHLNSLNGFLINANIIAKDNSDVGKKLVGQILEERIRPLDRMCQLEVAVAEKQLMAKSCVVHEILIRTPYDKALYHNCFFHVSVSPIAFMGDIMIESKAVFDIGSNPLFRYLKQKEFNLSATGFQITSDEQRFSSTQLDAIQRSFDLVMQPVSGQGNPCKVVMITGSPDPVRDSVTEIVNQLFTSEETRNHQYVVTGSEQSLVRMKKHVISQLPELFTNKNIFLAGNESNRIRNYTKNHISHTIDQLLAAVANEKDARKKLKNESKLKLLLKCKSCMESEETQLPLFVQAVADDFEYKALLHCLRSARLILGTMEQFSKSPAIMQHLKPQRDMMSKNTDPTTHSLSFTMIAEISDTMTEPELMAFANEFNIYRFILSESWFSSDANGGTNRLKKNYSLDHSMSHRLRKLSLESETSLVVDVGL